MSSILETLTGLLASAATHTKYKQQTAMLSLQFTEASCHGLDDESRLKLEADVKNLRIPGVTVDRFLNRGSLGCTYVGTVGADAVVVKVLSAERIKGLKREMSIVRGICTGLSMINATIPAVVENLAANVDAETDYVREAQMHERFFQAFGDASLVRIPKIYRHLSSAQHLVMEYVDMKPLPLVDVRSLSAEAVMRIGDALVRFNAATLYTHSLIYGDMNPGNILVSADGAVTVVDFGCCEVLSHTDLATLSELMHVGRGQTFQGFLDSCRHLHVSCNIPDLQLLYDFIKRQGRPFCKAHSGEFTREWFHTLTDDIPFNVILGIKFHPKSSLALRSLYGLSAILTHLGYRGDAHGITVATIHDHFAVKAREDTDMWVEDT